MSRTTRVVAAVAASVIGATAFAGVADAGEVAPSPSLAHLSRHSDHRDRDRGLVGDLVNGVGHVLYGVGRTLRPVVRAVF
jgi:hypothetical protein